MAAARKSPSKVMAWIGKMLAGDQNSAQALALSLSLIESASLRGAAALKDLLSALGSEGESL